MIFSVFVITRTLFSRRSRRLVRYDCGGFTKRVPIASAKTDVTKSPAKRAGRSGTKGAAREIYIGVEGTKVCIESRNANASNIDTASPFERSLNLSPHSSHPFPCSARATNPNTTVRAHATPARALQNGKTHARTEGEWVESRRTPLPINRMCEALA